MQQAGPEAINEGVRQLGNQYDEQAQE